VFHVKHKDINTESLQLSKCGARTLENTQLKAVSW
jgi:hypothetical protein